MNDKIAIIDALGAHGSSHNLYLYGQANGLAKSGLSISIYTNNITPNPNYNEVRFFQFYRNVFKHKSRIISGIRYVFGSIFSVFHAKFSGCRICHYHIFHINILVLFDFILTKLLAMKVVYTVHDVISFEEKRSSERLKNWIYKRADKILTHNQFSADTFKRQYSELKSEIEIIPHGNYLPFLNIIKDKYFAREYIGVPKNKKVLLFFGMIKKVKGLEVLLKSLKEVKLEHPDVFLVIAGKVWEDDFSIYQKIIDQYGLKEYCMIHNKFIEHSDVNYYYAAADLVVLPYKKIYQSGVLMMSMSYEKAVLVSDLPPLTDIVKDKKTGFTFRTEDPDSLSRKLNYILSNLDILEKIRNNGVQFIKTKYDWKEIGMQIKRSYKSIF